MTIPILDLKTLTVKELFSVTKIVLQSDSFFLGQSCNLGYDAVRIIEIRDHAAAHPWPCDVWWRNHSYAFWNEVYRWRREAHDIGSQLSLSALNIIRCATNVRLARLPGMKFRRNRWLDALIELEKLHHSVSQFGLHNQHPGLDTVVYFLEGGSPRQGPLELKLKNYFHAQ